MIPEAIAAISALAGLLKGGGNSNANGLSGLPPELQAELMKMLQLQTQRAGETAPIHQAAMAMASRLAPKYARDAMTGAPSGAPSGLASGPGNPSLNGNSLNTQFGSGSFNPSASGNPYVDSGVQFVNGRPYQVPGGSSKPTTGPEDPDVMHHPTLNDSDRAVSEALQRWFMGNPQNAFFGNGMSSGGEQTWNGGRGRAV